MDGTRRLNGAIERFERLEPSRIRMRRFESEFALHLLDEFRLPTAMAESSSTSRTQPALYRQIVEQYPNSPYASQAKDRLAGLEKR